MTNHEVYELLHDYVLDARALRLNFFPDMDGDIRETDLGLRTLFDEAREYDSLRAMIRSLKHGEILSLEDWMRIRLVLFRSDTESGFYSIGPFRSKPFTEEDYRQIRTMTPNISDSYFLQSMLNPVPVNISEIEALTLARQILLRFYGVSQPVVRTQKLSEQNLPSKFVPDPEREALAIRRVEEVYAHQDQLMNAVAAGDYDKALVEARFFMTKPPVVRNNTTKPQSTRDMLHGANTSCRLSAQKVGIHPVHLDDISQKYTQIISAALTEEQLLQVYLEMLYDYCQLCREYPARGCSPTLQKVVNYIGLNISNDLSLETIAKEVNFSAAYIIKKFREELNTTPIAYITSQRVQTAKGLLRNSSLSIREISQYVGIDDWNYFTKVFRKETGVTPSQYRKSAPAAGADT